MQVLKQKISPQNAQYHSFDQFYPFYLSQHSNATSRRLHVIGTTLAVLQLIRILLFGFSIVGLLLVVVVGYSFAWVGHYFFEKNKPATFKYPSWSLMGDFKMAYQIYTGKRKF